MHRCDWKARFDRSVTLYTLNGGVKECWKFRKDKQISAGIMIHALGLILMRNLSGKQSTRWQFSGVQTEQIVGYEIGRDQEECTTLACALRWFRGQVGASKSPESCNNNSNRNKIASNQINIIAYCDPLLFLIFSWSFDNKFESFGRFSFSFRRIRNNSISQNVYNKIKMVTM